MKRYVIALAIVSTILVIAGISFMSYKAYIALATPTVPAPVLSKYDVGPPDATEMLELVNEERAKVGSSPVSSDEALTGVAQWKSSHMADNGYYAHKMPGTDRNYDVERYAQLATRCTLAPGYVSENLSFAYEENTSRVVVQGWMTSKAGHREALLNANRSITGIAVASDHNKHYLITQIFC